MVPAPSRAVVRIIAVEGTNRWPVDVPLFPAAEPIKDFQIADGRTVTAWRGAVRREEISLGEGNSDGNAAPGEQFAVLLPDGDALRAAELFSNHPCIDLSARASDGWGAYDHVGGSAKYSLPRVTAACQPGTVVRMLARIVLPDKPEHKLRYATIEFPVWWRTETK
jgi:hypothetical protein